MQNSLLWVILLAAVPTSQVWAQTVQTFGWQFESSMPNNLIACDEYVINTIANPHDARNTTANSYFGTPPYFMLAIPEGGRPINTTLVGTGPTGLKWTPTHPPGTRLILHMLDSLGNSGGTPDPIFLVTPGSQTGCTSQPTTSFTVNSTIPLNGALETCQRWRLNIQGGTPPYTVILNAEGSPVITFIPLASKDDAVRYVNRVDPDCELFAAVKDSAGNWATGTPFVQTRGSQDFECGGLGTETGLQSQLPNDDVPTGGSQSTTSTSDRPATPTGNSSSTDRSEQSSKRPIGVIVGIVVAAVLILLLGGIAGWFYLRRRKRNLKESQDIVPRQYTANTTMVQTLSVGPVPPSNPSLKPGWTPSAETAGSPNILTLPISASRPLTKAAEASRDGMSATTSTTGNLTQSVNRSDFTRQETIEEVIIQHEDAGLASGVSSPIRTVVRELPPPYAQGTM